MSSLIQFSSSKRLLLAHALSVGLHSDSYLLSRSLSAWSIPSWIVAKKKKGGGGEKKPKTSHFQWKMQMWKLSCYCHCGKKKNTKIFPSHSLLSKDVWWDIHRELSGNMEALEFKRLKKTTWINTVLNSSSSICISAIVLDAGIIPLLR